jgi:hypothetical protein
MSTSTRADARAIGPSYLRACRTLGVLNEVEEFAVLPVENQPDASLALLFYYPVDKTEVAQMKSAAMEGVQFVKASDVLTPDELASMRTRAALVREDRIYSQCNTLVMDVDRAAKDPARAQACSNTMAVIDRKRAARQQAKDHREQMAMAQQQHAEQQVELERIHEDSEASRRVQEKAYDWLRWREFNRELFGRGAIDPVPPPR